MGEQPLLDGWGLVGGGVVEDQVDGQVVGDFLVDRGQELLELDRAVPRVQGADDLAGGDVECGVETGGAVALVVVGCALGGAGQHRQDRRGAVQGLDLGLRAPRGAASSDGGERTPSSVCRSRPGEAEGSLRGETPVRVGAALTKRGRVGTARRPGPPERDGKVYVRNQRCKASQEIHRLEPGGSGPERGARPNRVIPARATPVRGEVARREATRKVCGVLVAMPQGQSWAPTPSIGEW